MNANQDLLATSRFSGSPRVDRPRNADHSGLASPESLFSSLASWNAFLSYVPVQELGRGQNGVGVLLECSKTGARVVAKRICAHGMNEDELLLLEREVGVKAPIPLGLFSE